MAVLNYINKIAKVYAKGDATEHSYRRDLQNLANELISSIEITNEPKRIKCGSPDYVISKKGIPKGYIEAKDVGKNLDEIEKSEQLKRYRASLPNLILTDYLEFRFFRDGEKVNTIQIASLENGKIKPISTSFKLFENSFANFCAYEGQQIKSPEKLAKMMALKARLMEDVIFKVVNEEDEDNTLRDQLYAFRQILIHDLNEKTFADIYAQTIAYGLFAARLHDTTIEDFSRQEARTLIPKSNPFLRSLFDYVLGPELDERVVWIVDDLAEIFRATDIEKIIKGFGKSTGQNDPFIHFYETFLGEYNPKLRKSRGVYYTPEPVVNFIVRAVDDILKDEFGLAKGLADTSKTKVKYEILKRSKRSKGFKKEMKEAEVHKVQILDPATGTGTFLAEIIKQIHSKFEGQKGLWSKYVEEHLLPRVNGFEILMAPYTMCHLKIEMLLKDTGYVPKEEKYQKRLKVFLTNSLEEAPPESGTLFASWLSKEANAASHIKENTPVMVVIGNPPYSGISQNMGEWASNLIEDYKYVDGEHFGERKHWLHDDYVKFIRYGEKFIEKNEEGILAYINNHSFLDNPTFRGMRWHLLKTFDKIYIIDLHGNSKKKEKCPDGSKDENVFDIKNGVSINLFVRTGKKKTKNLAEVFHYDMWGKREEKYDSLWNTDFNKIKFESIKLIDHWYFFKPIHMDSTIVPKNHFKPNDLFISSVTGTQTGNDNLLVAETESELKSKLEEITEKPINEEFIQRITYRPFEEKNMYFIKSLTSKPYPEIKIPPSYRSRYKVMRHMTKENYGLIIGRQGQVVGSEPWNLVFITNNVTDLNVFYRGGGMVFPMYIYNEDYTEIEANFNIDIVEKISQKIGLNYEYKLSSSKTQFAQIDVIDYVYAVLHSSKYRKKYESLLKFDFPLIPYPDNSKTFWKLAKLGGELRQIHLLESPKVEEFITTYPIDGSNIVEKPKYEAGKVWINDNQYFDKVPEIAWNFYIGGYQPARKWLKDRKGRELSFDDIFHYQKIIVALTETDRIMKEIDKVIKF